MKFREKNDGGIEMHLDAAERKLIFRALRWYSGSHHREDEEQYADDMIVNICELLEVLECDGARGGERI